jgi:hypothetical protein
MEGHHIPKEMYLFINPGCIFSIGPWSNLIRERTLAGLKAARARGRQGGVLGGCLDDTSASTKPLGCFAQTVERAL